MKKSYTLILFALLSLSSWAVDMRGGLVANKGQWTALGKQIYFQSNDHRVVVRLTDQGLEYDFVQVADDQLSHQCLSFMPQGADLTHPIAVHPLSAVNYFNLESPVHTWAYEQVVYRDVYPQIDWVITSTQAGIKYDFIVHPGGNPADIKWKYKGVEDVKLNHQGELELTGKLGVITEHAPVSFQGKDEVKSKYLLREGLIGFELGKYNSQEDLVIDPEVIWTSYFGGEAFDEVNAITSDAAGNIYICGTTTSTSSISGSNGSGTVHQSNLNGSRDAFLAKFNANGVRLWASYYGGEGQDEGNALTMDSFGNVYIGGTTTSQFLIASYAFQTNMGGQRDGFVAKFNSNGQRLWSSYLGGSGAEYIVGLAADNEDRILVLGETASTDFPVVGTLDNNYGGQGDLFLTCITGISTLYWSTYYGGENVEYAGGIGYNVDTDKIYITGATASTTGIAVNASQPLFAGGLRDALMASFDEFGHLSWSTYVGGTGDDLAEQCSSDIYGNIYLIGTTNSNGLATPGAYQNAFGGGATDAFMAQYTEAGILVWRSYFGGSAMDEGKSMIADAVGNIYFGGVTSSSGLSINGFQSSMNGGTDLFFSKFTVEGLPQWTSYFGGPGNEELNYLSIDPSQKILFAGSAASEYLAVNGYQNALNGGQDGLFGRLEDCPNPYVTIVHDGELSFCYGESVTLAAGGADNFVWSTGDTTTFVTIDTTMVVHVRGLLNGCQGISHALYVEAKPVPEVILTPLGDVFFCDSAEVYVEIMAEVGPDSLIFDWHWNDLTQDDIHYVLEAGTVSVTAIAINECETSESVAVMVADLPDLQMALPSDSTCISAQPMNLVGLPSGGTFISDAGIVGNTFDPELGGGGVHYISYTYNDESSGCTATTPEYFLEVLYAPTELFVSEDTLCVFDAPILMSGFPEGGFYTGLGVSGNQFYPAIAGTGWHSVTYNYVDPQGCTNRAVRPIFVDPCGGVLESGQHGLQVYPNPASQWIAIQGKSDNDAFHIRDVQGRVVMQGMFRKGESIYIDNLASGVYSLRFLNEPLQQFYFVKE